MNIDAISELERLMPKGHETITVDGPAKVYVFKLLDAAPALLAVARRAVRLREDVELLLERSNAREAEVARLHGALAALLRVCGRTRGDAVIEARAALNATNPTREVLTDAGP